MIYELWNPLNNTPFYVGWTDTKTKGKNRPKEHLKEERRAGSNINTGNRLKLNIIRKIRKSGMDVEIREVFYTDDLDQSFNVERDLICQYGRRDLGKGTLSNMTDGGEGKVGVIDSEYTRSLKAQARIGKKHTAESINLIKSARKKQKPAVWSDDAKLKQSQRTHLRQNLGKTYDEIHGPEAGNKIKQLQREMLQSRRSNPDLEKQRVAAHKKCWIVKMEVQYRCIFELLDAGARQCDIIKTVGVSPDTIRKAKRERAYIENILNED